MGSERDSSFIHSNDCTSQGQARLRPGASSSSSAWVQWPRRWGHLLPLSQACQQGAGLEVEQLENKLPILYAGIAGGMLACTVLAPKCF